MAARGNHDDGNRNNFVWSILTGVAGGLTLSTAGYCVFLGARSWHYGERLNELEKQFSLPGGSVAEHPLLLHWVKTMERREAGALAVATERELSEYFDGAVAALPTPKEDEQWRGFFKGLAGMQKAGKNHERYQHSVRGIADSGREGQSRSSR